MTAANPYDPKIDLVEKDLIETPSVLAAIDRAWEDKESIESIAGHDLAVHLVECMKRRLEFNLDTIDLIVTGVEVSLWTGEQWAADIRAIFPQLNIVAVSANK